jgi:hypothetical protein
MNFKNGARAIPAGLAGFVKAPGIYNPLQWQQLNSSKRDSDTCRHKIPAQRSAP